MYACIYAYMPKVITISDEVYEKLSKLKGNKSFSEVINDLIEFYYENKKVERKFCILFWNTLWGRSARTWEGSRGI